MQLFGNRLHNNNHRRGALSPLAIILICVGAALLLAIIVGLLLNVWLDDEAYERLTKGEQKEEILHYWQPYNFCSAWAS